MPALLTRIDRPPWILTMSSINASTDAPSVTFNTRPSPPFARRRSPIASAPGWVVAVPITFAPRNESSSAIAAPMPREAPVTSATSPVNVLSMRVSVERRRKPYTETGSPCILTRRFTSPRLAGLIADFRGSDRKRLFGTLQEVHDHGNHALRFREQGEVARVRDHRELSIGYELESLDRMFETHEIAIALHDQERRRDGRELRLRKSRPPDRGCLVPKPRPVIGIGSNALVAFPLKQEGSRIGGKRGRGVQHFHVERGVRRPECRCIRRHAPDKIG